MQKRSKLGNTTLYMLHIYILGITEHLKVHSGLHYT